MSCGLRSHPFPPIRVLTRSDVALQMWKRQKEERTAADRKNKVAKLRKDRHAGTTTAKIERTREVEVAERHLQKAVAMVRLPLSEEVSCLQPLLTFPFPQQSGRNDKVTGGRNDKVTGTATAAPAYADRKGKAASKGYGRDEKSAADNVTKLKSQKVSCIELMSSIFDVFDFSTYIFHLRPMRSG